MESITHPKVSVITVVYNDVEHIRQTIESFCSQTWEEKEYIVIDGGSKTGQQMLSGNIATYFHTGVLNQTRVSMMP